MILGLGTEVPQLGIHSARSIGKVLERSRNSCIIKSHMFEFDLFHRKCMKHIFSMCVNMQVGKKWTVSKPYLKVCNSCI